MNVVDSSGWLEYFADDENSDFFSPVIEDVQALIVPVISVFEVFKRVLLQRGENDALEAAAAMYQGRLVDLTPTLALSAARTSAEHQLPMADSIILATARAENAILWTQDEDFKEIEGVQYIHKPNKGG